MQGQLIRIPLLNLKITKNFFFILLITFILYKRSIYFLKEEKKSQRKSIFLLSVLIVGGLILKYVSNLISTHNCLKFSSLSKIGSYLGVHGQKGFVIPILIQIKEKENSPKYLTAVQYADDYFDMNSVSAQEFSGLLRQ